MNKQSDDFRAYLGSLFDPDSAPENTPENKKTQATKNTVSDKEQTQASAHEHPHEETVTDIHDTGETADLLDLLADESEQGAAEEALSPDEASLTTEELFQQAAQEAQARRREKEAKKRKEEAKEAAAWLRDTVRDESADSSQGFDFLDTEKEQGIPLPDEWPAFADIDEGNTVTRYGTDNQGDEDLKSSADADSETTSDSTLSEDVTDEDAASTDDVADDDSESGLFEDGKLSFKQRFGRFAGGFVGAIVVLALAGASAYGVWHGHWQSQRVKAPAFQGNPVPAQLACSGGFARSLEVGVNVEDTDEQIIEGSRLVATGSAKNGNTSLPAPANKNSLSMLGSPKPSSAFFRADDAGTSIGGLNLHRAQAGDMRGLAGAACVNGQIDTYLVGSQISVGTSNELVLVNLSNAPATVRLEALGSAGVLEATSIESIVVNANAVKRVPLDGAIDGDKRLALHISSSGGAIGAFVQETVLDGAKPAGVTWISPSVSAAHLVIPAVSIPLNSVDFPKVRVANFEDSPASVSLVLRSDKGVVEGADLSGIEVAAHSVLDIPLEGIDGGIYSVVVTSDIPVSAGAELVYRASEDAAREIAWANAVSPAYEGLGVFGNATGTLALAGAENGKATVAFYNNSGAQLESSRIDISQSRSTIVDIPADAVAVQVTADVPVSGGIYRQPPLGEGDMAVDWLPLVSRTTDIGSQHISLW